MDKDTELDDACFYNVKEYISEENIKNICKELSLSLITSQKELMIDINLGAVLAN